MTELTEGYDDETTELYLTAFPEDERRNAEEWKRLHEEDERFCIYKIKKDGETEGLITLWRFKDFCYVEHFAVKEKKRNNGTGTEVLKILKEREKNIVLEVELPTASAEAERRHEFYKRNGFSDFTERYKQPAYEAGRKEVEMRVMHTGETDFKTVRDILYREVYKQTR